MDAELNASVESRRALAKIAATPSRRVHELLPLTDQTLASVAAALVDQWAHNHEIAVSATIDQAQIERAQGIFGLCLVRDDHAESATGQEVTIRFLRLEDVRALLPLGNAIIVQGPTEARTHLRALATNLAHDYAPSPTS